MSYFFYLYNMCCEFHNIYGMAALPWKKLKAGLDLFLNISVGALGAGASAALRYGSGSTKLI
jgi:hypothetical protein